MDRAPPVADAVARASALAVGDVLEIRVFGENAVSGTYRIDGKGGVRMPLIGTVSLAGLHPSDAADLLSDRLRVFIQQPQVSVQVRSQSSKKVYVLGQVRTPGTFLYEEGMNVIQAITLAGGFGDLAAQNNTIVTRIRDGQERRLQVAVEDIGRGEAPNVALQPGDIVYVPETLF